MDPLRNRAHRSVQTASGYAPGLDISSMDSKDLFELLLHRTSHRRKQDDYEATVSFIERSKVQGISLLELKILKFVRIKVVRISLIVKIQGISVFTNRGLSPEQAKTAKKMKKFKRRSIHESFLQVGDTVALKERKEEIGAIVMNNCFMDGPKIGKIIKIIETDRNNEASDRKNYAIKILTTSNSHQGKE